MGELVKKSVPIQLDTECLKAEEGIVEERYIERNLIFNLNVIQKCVEKFGQLDDILKAIDISTVKWLAAEMINEDARIWNKKNPEIPKPYITEDDIGLYVVGVQGLNELQKKVREAMLLGLSPEQVEAVKVIEKNLMTAQEKNGKTVSLLKRFQRK